MNGYFQLIHEAGKTGIMFVAPTDGGKVVDINYVMEYLSMKDFSYNTVALKEAIEASANKDMRMTLCDTTRHLERECYSLIVSPDKMQAHVRFYAPSEGGGTMSAEEFHGDLAAKGIRFGVMEEAIAAYFEERRYCEDILIAQGQEPKQGKNGYIEYLFNTDKSAKPALREDGSVDFFNLDLVNQCSKGAVLAKLYPEIQGEPGSNIYGELIKPAEVRKERLRYGRNIAISEDATVLTSMIDGHVELVEDQVFVSEVLKVDNVDNSTGNIDYDGNVQINGNVCVNFSVKAGGDIIVNGVVEGAQLEAGGNIIIAKGMNGMGKGCLKAAGNIIVKFLENAIAEADGYISAESILHSRVMAGTEINVDGRRGFITGGRVSAATLVNVKTLGSPMGADTIIEVGADPKIKRRIVELQKQIAEDGKTLQSVQTVLVATKQKIAQGAKLNQTQLTYVQTLATTAKQKNEALQAANKELEELEKTLSGIDGMKIIVRGEVYPGTKLCIGDASMTVQSTTHYCSFIKLRGDVKMAPI